MLTFLVQLDPAIQNLIALGVTFVVSFLLLQLAALYPALAEYIGQYKVGIVTWATGLIVQFVQAQLNQVPVAWDGVLVIAMKLIVEVAIVLGAFALYRKSQIKGSRALR